VVSSSRVDVSISFFVLLSSLLLFVRSCQVPFMIRNFYVYPISCFFNGTLMARFSDSRLVIPRFPLYLS
jgi:hypothetical protein